MKNKKRSAEEIAAMRKQEYVTNKLLLVFTFAFVFLLYIMYLDNSKSTLTGFLELPDKVGTGLWISVAIFVAGAVWAIIEKFVTKRDTKNKLFTGMHLAIVGLFMTVCMYDLDSKIMNSPDAFTRLYVFIPIVVVLYIIYSSYQREFFFISLASSFGGIAIWNVKDYIFGDSEKIAILSAVLIVAVCAITIWAQLGKGSVKIFGKEICIFKSDARYTLIYLSFALVIALMVAAFLVADLTMYFLYGLLTYVVLAGVYYTIKLI